MRSFFAVSFLALLGTSPMAGADPSPAAATASAAAPAPTPAASAATAASTTTADKLLSCMKANLPPTVRVQTIEVTSFDRAGSERTLKGTIFATREEGKASVTLHVDAPTDLARSAYLVRENSSGDEIYLYLPTVNRTRRITGAAVDGNLWGSDISYNDLKQLQSAFDGNGVKLEAPTQIDGQPVEVMTFSPKAGTTTRYNLVRAYIDPKSCLAVKAEFLQGADVRKVMTAAAKDFKQSGTRWYPGEIQVQTPAEGTHTRVRVTGVSIGDKLSVRYFNPTAFYQ